MHSGIGAVGGLAQPLPEPEESTFILRHTIILRKAVYGTGPKGSRVL
jgi:hypothetical protein